MNFIKLILSMFSKTPRPAFICTVTGMKVHGKARDECLHVRPLDNQYKAITLDSFMTYMKMNTISDQQYEPEDYDCDDFALETLVDVKRWARGSPIGVVFGDDIGDKPHAWNCFFDVAHDQLYYFEPQDDTLYLPTTEQEWEIMI